MDYLMDLSCKSLLRIILLDLMDLLEQYDLTFFTFLTATIINSDIEL